MHQFSTRILLLLASLFLFNSSAAGQDIPAEVLRYSTTIRAGKTSVSETDTVIIRINGREGDSYSEVSVPWSKEEKITGLEAWIESAGGVRIRELKNSQVTDRSSIRDISLYEDHFVKEFSMKHTVYPYIIVYTYTLTRKNYLYYAYWSPAVFRSIPTHAASLNVIFPGETAVSHFSRHLAEPSIDSGQAETTMTWNGSYRERVKQELFSQPEQAMPLVVVAPLDFRYEIQGSARSWKDFGEWQVELLDGMNDLGEEEKRRILTVAGSGKDTLTVIRNLYHDLQDQTRYVNVTLGTGGYRPYPASYVEKNRYGDCKALSNYMKSMLEIAGIRSFYTLIKAEEQPSPLLADWVGPQFNHVILAVPAGGDTLWLENTSDHLPIGYNNTSIQNREALLVSKAESRIIRIPALRSKDVLTTSRMDISFGQAGEARISIHSTMRGRNFEEYVYLDEGINRERTDRIIRQILPFENYQLLKWQIGRPHRDTARVDLSAEISQPGVLKPLGKEYYFSLQPCDIPRFETPANRKLPVDIPYPVNIIDTLRYRFPAGYRLGKKQETVDIRSEYGSYRREAHEDENGVTFIRSYELYPKHVDISDYQKFYSFTKSVAEADRCRFLLGRTTEQNH